MSEGYETSLTEVLAGAERINKESGGCITFENALQMAFRIWTETKETQRLVALRAN